MPVLRLLVFLLLLAACIPATSPPQLENTPGPAVEISDRVYDSGIFQAQPPPDWQIITSAAAQTPADVIFAAPEGDALIMIGIDLTDAPAPAGYTGDLRSERRELELADGASISAILNAPPEKWSDYEAIFERVVNSLRAS